MEEHRIYSMWHRRSVIIEGHKWSFGWKTFPERYNHTDCDLSVEADSSSLEIDISLTSDGFHVSFDGVAGSDGWTTIPQNSGTIPIEVIETLFDIYKNRPTK